MLEDVAPGFQRRQSRAESWRDGDQRRRQARWTICASSRSISTPTRSARSVEVGVLRKGKVQNDAGDGDGADGRSRALCRHGDRPGQHGQSPGHCRRHHQRQICATPWATTCAFTSGVLVAARTPTSTLLGEGPQPGDIIHAVNGTPIKDLKQLKQSLRKLKPGDTIVLQIERSGLLSYLVLESE